MKYDIIVPALIAFGVECDLKSDHYSILKETEVRAVCA